MNVANMLIGFFLAIVPFQEQTFIYKWKRWWWSLKNTFQLYTLHGSNTPHTHDTHSHTYIIPIFIPIVNDYWRFKTSVHHVTQIIIYFFLSAVVILCVKVFVWLAHRKLFMGYQFEWIFTLNWSYSRKVCMLCAFVLIPK